VVSTDPPHKQQRIQVASSSPKKENLQRPKGLSLIKHGVPCLILQKKFDEFLSYKNLKPPRGFGNHKARDMLLDPIFHRGLVLLPYPAVQLGQHIQTC
jgi:hypothetical protein